jgi:hypothetical protein
MQSALNSLRIYQKGRIVKQAEEIAMNSSIEKYVRIS